MIKHFFFTLGLLFVATDKEALAQEPSPTEKAEASLRSGVPQAALAPLEEALSQASGPEKNTLGLLLARAQLAAGQPVKALTTLDHPGYQGSAEAVLLRATALASQGKLKEAVALASPQVRESPEAALLLARVLLEQGKSEEARHLLSPSEGPLPEDPHSLRLLLDLQFAEGDPKSTEELITAAKEGDLLPQSELAVALGRLRLSQNKPSEASEIFRDVLTADDLPSPVRENASNGLARALIALGVDELARDILRQSIARTPNAFTMRPTMEQWLSLETQLGGDPSQQLQGWAAELGSLRSVEAKLQLAQFNLKRKRPEEAMTLLYTLAADPSFGPEANLRSQLLLAEAHIATGESGVALELLQEIPVDDKGPASNYRVADLQGRALAATGAHRTAYDAFAKARNSARTQEETAAAAINGLLSALAVNDLDLARKSYELFRQATPSHPDLIRWSFLLAAAEARKNKIDGLVGLARRSPSVQYAFQAKLALAEWRLQRGEAAAAERILRTARDQAETEPQAASIAAAEIFAADNAGSRTREELVAACQEFLATHPVALDVPDIAFKLAELHSRGGDYGAAETVLGGLSQSLTDPESAALAKFLAAKSASRSMSPDGAERALLWFGEIASGKSPLQHRARLEQASLLLRDQRLDDALILYDRILGSNPPSEVRNAALMEKGDTLLSLGVLEKAKFLEASTIYAILTADTSAPSDWRDQAAVKRAVSLARAGQPEAAMAAYREVLARPPGTEADRFWFYKAGLEAGQLLEEQEDWPAAIAIYDQMASMEGPQREDMVGKARRLRLEHFIWEN